MLIYPYVVEIIDFLINVYCYKELGQRNIILFYYKYMRISVTILFKRAVNISFQYFFSNKILILLNHQVCFKSIPK